VLSASLVIGYFMAWQLVYIISDVIKMRAIIRDKTRDSSIFGLFSIVDC